MTTIIEDEVLKIAQFEFEQQDWDAMPTVFLFYREGGETRSIIVGLAGLEAPLPASLYGMGEAIIMANSSPFPDMPDFIGLCVRSEGYGISMDKGDPNEIQAFLDRGGRIADHPLGVEVLSVLGIDADGVYAAGYRRGDPEATVMPDQVEGRLIDGVRRLYEGLTSVATRS